MNSSQPVSPTTPDRPTHRRRHWSVWFIALAVSALLAVLLMANAQLVLVAFESQPDCVPHDKVGNADAGVYRAAKSSC